MIFYSLLYNISLRGNSALQSFDIPYLKDNNLLALKLSMDNAILEQKAKQRGLEIIPEIEMSA